MANTTVSASSFIADLLLVPFALTVVSFPFSPSKIEGESVNAKFIPSDSVYSSSCLLAGASSLVLLYNTVTDSASFRRAVVAQSRATSPPPITTTCLPALKPAMFDLAFARYSTAVVTPSSSIPGTSRVLDICIPAPSIIAL